MDVGKNENRKKSWREGVGKNVVAAGAKATTEDKIVSTLMFLVAAPSCVPVFTKEWMYLCFLHIGGAIVGLAPRLAPASRPGFVPSVPAGYGLPVTLAVFGVATLVVQAMLARVLKRRPAPAPPRLTPERAWSLGIFTWMLLTLFFHNYLSFGGDDYFVRECCEWAMARRASALNLFLASYTVIEYLA